jgi:hypothetical protein
MAACADVAAAIYKALLRLYPGRFHDEFAPDMALDFADASDDAWERRRWRGLVALWTRTGADLAASLAVQWMRTGIPLVAIVAFTATSVAASMAFTLAPSGPLLINIAPDDRELVFLLFTTACVLLIVAATIIFSLWFLRPLLYRKAPAKKI